MYNNRNRSFLPYIYMRDTMPKVGKAHIFGQSKYILEGGKNRDILRERDTKDRDRGVREE